jgi:hypothetical protein
MPKITVEVSEETQDALAELIRRSDGPMARDLRLGHFNTGDLARYVLERCAEGWKRPGSWERGMLEQMGLA